jgi:hypothetical protein
MVLGEQADRVAEQARGGLAAGAQQCQQDGACLELAEHAAVHAAGDRAEDVAAGILHCRREMTGEPGLDVAKVRDELVQLVVGQRGPEHRGGAERRAEELADVGVAEAYQSADRGNRHDVADRRHEVGSPAAQCPRNAPAGEADDVGLERGHSRRDQLGEDGAAVKRMDRRIRGGEHLYASLAEGGPGRQPGSVPVQEARDVRGEIRWRPAASAVSPNVLTVYRSVPGILHTGARARSNP